MGTGINLICGAIKRIQATSYNGYFHLAEMRSTQRIMALHTFESGSLADRAMCTMLGVDHNSRMELFRMGQLSSAYSKKRIVQLFEANFGRVVQMLARFAPRERVIYYGPAIGASLTPYYKTCWDDFTPDEN